LAGEQSPSAATWGEQGLTCAGLLGGTGAILGPGVDAGRAFEVAAFEVAVFDVAAFEVAALDVAAPAARAGGGERLAD